MSQNQLSLNPPEEKDMAMVDSETETLTEAMQASDGTRSGEMVHVVGEILSACGVGDEAPVSPIMTQVESGNGEGLSKRPQRQLAASFQPHSGQ